MTVANATPGVTHRVVLGNTGYQADTRNLIKSDITQTIPRVTISDAARRHQDFSDLDTFGQESFHHGRGEKDWNDPFAFYTGRRIDTRVKRQVTIGPAQNKSFKTGGSDPDFNGAPSAFFQFASNFYMLINGTTEATNALYVWNNSTSAWDTVAAGIDTNTGTMGNMEAFNGYLFVAQGEVSGDDIRRFDGVSTWDAITGIPARYLKQWDNLLWRADNINELWYTADPTAGSPTWVGPFQAGDTTAFITGLAVFQNQLHVFKQDGIYIVEVTGSTYRIAVLLDQFQSFDVDNGKGNTNWNGFLYYNTTGGGISRFDGATVEALGPDRGAIFEEATFQGALDRQEFRSLIGTSNWLFAAGDSEDDNSQVLAYGGTGWHSFIDAGVVALDTVSHLPALTAANVLATPTLWYNKAEEVFYSVVPEGTDNPDDFAAFTYDTNGGFFVTPWFDAKLPDLDKAFYSITVISEKVVASAQEIEVAYQIDKIGGPEDADSDWISLGTVQQSPTAILRFPDGALHKWSTVAQSIRFKFKLTTTSASLSPIFKEYFVRFTTRPPTRWGWNLPIKYEDNLEGIDHERETLSKTQIQQRLWAARDRRDALFFDDALGPPTNVINQFTNPSFEVNTTNWAVRSGAAVTRDHIYKVGTGYSGKIVADGTDNSGVNSSESVSVPDGSTVYMSAHLYHKSGAAIDLYLWDSTNNAIRSSDLAIAIFNEEADYSDPFRRHTFQWTNSTGSPANVQLVAESGSAAAATFYLDRCAVIVSTIADLVDEFYLDGDQTRCHWTGVPHASTSHRPRGYSVYVTGVNESPRSPEVTYDANDNEVQTVAGVINVQLREIE